LAHFASKAGLGQLVAALVTLATLFVDFVNDTCSPIERKSGQSLFPTAALPQTLKVMLGVEKVQMGANGPASLASGAVGAAAAAPPRKAEAEERIPLSGELAIKSGRGALGMQIGLRVNPILPFGWTNAILRLWQVPLLNFVLSSMLGCLVDLILKIRVGVILKTVGDMASEGPRNRSSPRWQSPPPLAPGLARATGRRRAGPRRGHTTWR